MTKTPYGATYAALVTDAALAEIINARSNGLALNLTQIAFGDGGGADYAGTTEQTALLGERERHDIMQSQTLGPGTFLLAVKVTGGQSFPIREVGIFSDQGTLIALATYQGENTHHMVQGEAFTFEFIVTFSGASEGEIVVSITGEENTNLLFVEEFAQVTQGIAALSQSQIEMALRLAGLEGRMAMQIQTFAGDFFREWNLKYGPASPIQFEYDAESGFVTRVVETLEGTQRVTTFASNSQAFNLY